MDIRQHNDDARRIVRHLLDGRDAGVRRHLRAVLGIADAKIGAPSIFRTDPEAAAIINACEYCDFLTPPLWEWLQANSKTD